MIAPEPQQVQQQNPMQPHDEDEPVAPPKSSSRRLYQRSNQKQIDTGAAKGGSAFEAARMLIGAHHAKKYTPESSQPVVVGSLSAEQQQLATTHKPYQRNNQKKIDTGATKGGGSFAAARLLIAAHHAKKFSAVGESIEDGEPSPRTVVIETGAVDGSHESAKKLIAAHMEKKMLGSGATTSTSPSSAPQKLSGALTSMLQARQQGGGGGNSTSEVDMEVVQKYQKMLKVGMPEGAVRQKMKMDKISPSVQELVFSPTPTSGSGGNKKNPAPITTTRSRHNVVDDGDDQPQLVQPPPRSAPSSASPQSVPSQPRPSVSHAHSHGQLPSALEIAKVKMSIANEVSIYTALKQSRGKSGGKNLSQLLGGGGDGENGKDDAKTTAEKIMNKMDVMNRITESITKEQHQEEGKGDKKKKWKDSDIKSLEKSYNKFRKHLLKLVESTKQLHAKAKDLRETKSKVRNV